MKNTHILLATLLTALAFPAFAEDKHDHKEGEKHAGHEEEVQVVVPETPAALWTEIDQQMKTLSDLIAAKKADGMHIAAETVEALVSAVPGKYPELAVDKKKRVAGMAKNAAAALDKLHEESEEGHWDDVAKGLKQVESAIKIIRTQVGA